MNQRLHHGASKSGNPSLRAPTFTASRRASSASQKGQLLLVAAQPSTPSRPPPRNMTRFAKSIGVAAQLLTFSAQASASQHLPAVAHGRALDVAPSPGFSVTYGGCRACEEGVFACAHNANGPELGLFTTIGFSDFELDAAFVPKEP